MKNLKSNVTVVNPLAQQEWNEGVLKCSHSTIFHSANWARLLADSYGYHPTYLTLPESSSFRACLPVMEVNSVLTGRRGVSLSFSDYCVALVQEPDEFKILFDAVLELGKMSGWQYVEFRGEQFLQDQLPAKVYVHHDIELCEDEGVMHSRLRESTARNIRKAVKEGVAVTMSDSLEGVRDFYRLHCLTRKRQGLPPQPDRFFEKLHEHVIGRGLGFTALARKGDTLIGGIVCLHFGRNAVYKYGASDLQFQHLRANNLVMWEAMKRCAARGCRSFSMGRTDLDNEGLIAFKNGWGGTKSLLNYYRYDFSTSRFVSDEQRHMELYRQLLKKLPIKVLRMLGTFAYRHMG